MGSKRSDYVLVFFLSWLCRFCDQLRYQIWHRMKIRSLESAEARLNGIIADLEEIQDRVAVLSDELDEDMLEGAEEEIDIVLDKIGDVIEKHGWKVR